MRLVIFAFLALFCALCSLPSVKAGTYQSNGGYSGTPSAAVMRVFAAFPSGGDGLTAASRELLISDPGLADDVAYVVSRGNPMQQSAAAAGIAQAFVVLANRDDKLGTGRIANAVSLSGNPVLQTAVSAASGIKPTR